ncbi:MAG: hypothetical protein CBE21_05730 [Proteobacteria bacterium TMED261]|nr:MAG: hypothetical protein CBE21_05730 [Proteobacteria bacterium TMED261]
MNDKSANLLSLFASSSTLICCALPAAFILIGAGASFATLINLFPFLPILSKYKVLISLVAFILISVGGYTHYKTYRMPCPTDPELGRACLQTRKRSRYLYYFSVFLFLFATIFTYIVPGMI